MPKATEPPASLTTPGPAQTALGACQKGLYLVRGVPSLRERLDVVDALEAELWEIRKSATEEFYRRQREAGGER